MSSSPETVLAPDQAEENGASDPNGQSLTNMQWLENMQGIPSKVLPVPRSPQPGDRPIATQALTTASNAVIAGTSADGELRMIGPAATNLAPPKPRKPTNSSFDPYGLLSAEDGQTYKEKNTKPPFSYSQMIVFAINGSAKKMLTLNDIYMWIAAHFPYFPSQSSSAWRVRGKCSFIFACAFCSFGRFSAIGDCWQAGIFMRRLPRSRS